MSPLNRRTWVEAPLFLVLLGVGTAIGIRLWNRVNEDSAPVSAPTPTPRVSHLLRTIPAPLPPSRSENPDRPASATPEAFTRETTQPETGILVLQIREEDGSLPIDPVIITGPFLPEGIPVENGRLVLETVTGTLELQARASNATSVRESELGIVDVETGVPALLELTLPPLDPSPQLVSAGLALRREPEGFWTIVEVSEGSAAAKAGLRPDDAVLSIGNATPSMLTDAETAAALLGRPDERILLQMVIRTDLGELEEVRIELVLQEP